MLYSLQFNLEPILQITLLLLVKNASCQSKELVWQYHLMDSILMNIVEQKVADNSKLSSFKPFQAASKVISDLKIKMVLIELIFLVLTAINSLCNKTWELCSSNLIFFSQPYFCVQKGKNLLYSSNKLVHLVLFNILTVIF